MTITPVLVVERIEECLPVWVDRLGFEKTVEVPEGDRLGFVILAKDGAQVMLQTRASVEKDHGHTNALGTGSSSLFIVVDDFDDIRKRVAGADIVIPERVTFYGMREIAIREPGGHLICFAVRESAAVQVS
jgi:uncharacterized glyoxalase superfamily protein PhnB